MYEVMNLVGVSEEVSAALVVVEAAAEDVDDVEVNVVLSTLVRDVEDTVGITVDEVFGGAVWFVVVVVGGFGFELLDELRE